MSDELMPCPFCGWQADKDLDDVVYPTGTYAHFIDPNDKTQGLNFNSSPKGAAYTLFRVVCTQNMGGCGASVTGLDRARAVKAWNTRAPKGTP